MKLINENVTERFDDFKDYYERVPEDEQEHTDLATKIYDNLTNAGYNVYGREHGEGYEVSKKFEKNLEKAKKVCDDMNIPYHVEHHRDRYYLVVDLDGIDYERVVESLKNDEIDQFFRLAKRMGIQTMKDLDIALNEPEAFNKNGKKKESELNQLKALAKSMNLNHKDYSKHDYVDDKYKEPVKEDLDRDQLLNHEDSFRYQLLDRLRSDCDYWLGNGGRTDKFLWAQNPKDQIDAMEILYNSFAEDKKPEWFTREMLDFYREKMLNDSEPLEEEKLSTKNIEGKDLTFDISEDDKLTFYKDDEEIGKADSENIEDLKQKLKAMGFREKETAVVKESLEEDIAETTPASEIEIESGLVTLINDLINDENDAINAYESAIVNLEICNRSELTDAIREILNDEQKHVGSLQVILNEIKPGTQTEIEAGKEETLDILNNESEPEEVINTNSIEAIG